MRSDFNRVLTEDPRRGSDWKFRQYRRAKGNATFDDQFSGGKESMMAARRRAGGSRKSFGDLLGPLKGWVRQQVGRKWDDTYSEVCALFDRRRVIHDHVHQHLFNDFIDINTRLIDDKVCVYGGHFFGWTDVNGVKYSRHVFYVHPTTGILCSTYKENAPGAKEAAEAAKHAKLAKWFREHDADTHLLFEDGQWMVYTIRDIPALVNEIRRPDHILYFDWAKMTEGERAREGVIFRIRPAYNPLRTRGAFSGPSSSNRLPRNRYYATRQTAARAILKQHGLLGTAEYIEDGSKLSARAMAKYQQPVL